MSKQRGLVLFVALAALFLVVNRGAYSGYFHEIAATALPWCGGDAPASDAG
jgi:hypothetical protein